jgi:hypothetical protein
MRPSYFQSIEIHRGTYNADGSLTFSGTAASTVSGTVFRRRVKEVVTAGEVVLITAQGFLELGADVLVADHLLSIAPAAVSGQRFEVMQTVVGRDHRGRDTHVGVELRDTAAN